jgi:hypothetical protein
MGDLSVKYGFYSAEYDPKTAGGVAVPMGEGTFKCIYIYIYVYIYIYISIYIEMYLRYNYDYDNHIFIHVNNCIN